MARKQKKSQSEPYLVIPRRTIRSPELNSLSISARWLYIILCSEWRRNNGNEPFTFTYEQIREITSFCKSTLSHSLKELENASYIKKENHGGLLRNPNTYTMNESHLYIKQERTNSGTHGSNN